MYYIIQENIFKEHQYQILIDMMGRFNFDYEIVKFRPFIHEIEFKTDRKDVFCFGAVAMSASAKKYNWNPGSMLNDNHDFEIYSEKYGNQGLTDSIFLIEKIWIDSWENEIGRAVGYLPHCFANTKEEAEEFCSKGRIYTRKDCWAIYGAQPEYKYSELKHCKQDGI